MAGIAIVSSGRAGCEGNAAAGTVSMLANGRDHGTVALLPHLGKDRIILVQARLLLWHMQVKSPARGRTFFTVDGLSLTVDGLSLTADGRGLRRPPVLGARH